MAVIVRCYVWQFGLIHILVISVFFVGIFFHFIVSPDVIVSAIVVTFVSHLNAKQMNLWCCVNV